MLPKPMAHPIAFDLGARLEDPLNLCVFGLEKGRATLDLFGRRVQAYIHPLFCGMWEADDSMIWGTLELRFSGRSGSELGKFVQGYSPISHLIKANGEYTLAPPTTMKQLRSKKPGLVPLVDTIVCNLGKVTGARVEVRAGEEGGTVEDTIAQCGDILEELCDFCSPS